MLGWLKLYVGLVKIVCWIS